MATPTTWEEYQKTIPAGESEPTTWEEYQKTIPTAAQSFAGSAGRAVGPMAAFMGAAPTGATAGAELLSPLGPVGSLVGGGIGGMVTGGLAAWGAQKAQTALADRLAPESFLGSKKAEAQEAEHPIASHLGGLLPMGMPNPLGATRALATLATGEGRAAVNLMIQKGPAALARNPQLLADAQNALNVGQGAAMMAGFDLFDQLKAGTTDPVELIRATLEGVLMSKPWVSLHGTPKAEGETKAPIVATEPPPAETKPGEPQSARFADGSIDRITTALNKARAEVDANAQIEERPEETTARIQESAGQPIYPTLGDHNAALAAAGFPPDTEAAWRQFNESQIEKLVEKPAQALVRKVLADGNTPTASNAFGPGKKGVLFVRPDGSQGFEPLETAVQALSPDELVAKARDLQAAMTANQVPPELPSRLATPLRNEVGTETPAWKRPETEPPTLDEQEALRRELAETQGEQPTEETPVPPAQPEAAAPWVKPGQTVIVRTSGGRDFIHKARVIRVDEEHVQVKFTGGAHKGEYQSLTINDVQPLRSTAGRTLYEEQFAGMTPEERKQTKAEARQFDDLVDTHGPQAGWIHPDAVDMGMRVGTKDAQIQESVARARAQERAMAELGEPNPSAKDSLAKGRLLPKLKQLVGFREATSDTTKPETARAEFMTPGEKFTIDGETMTVKQRLPDGTIILDDGRKFGERRLSEGETIYVDKSEGGKQFSLAPDPEGGKTFSVRGIHPDHQKLAELGLKYGVTWKGRNYGTGDWKLSDAVESAISLSRRMAEEYGIAESDPTVEDVAFKAVRARGNGIPDPGLVRRLLESTLEETKAGKIAAVRQKLITREHEEIGNRLREYRQQNSFRMYSPKGARDHGYDINRVEMGVAAENPLSGELTPTEVAEWRNKKGDILYKVEGYTEPALGRYGQMIDDPYDGPMDGSHSADSKFIEIKAGDDRNPDEVWKAYQAEQKRLETEVAGDFNQMAAQSRGHLFSLADHPGFFDRPESIEEQKARLAQEKADRVLEQKRQAMLAKAGRRLTGEDVDTTGDLLPGARVDKQGQGSFFSPGGEPGLTHSEAQQRITEAINEKHATFQGDSSSASQGHHDVVRRAESAFRGVFAGRETAFGNTAVDRDFYTTQTGRRLAALAQKHGAEVVFFKGDAYAPKGFTYLGRLFLRSNRPEAQLVQTFEHELAHHRANNGNETMAALENEVDLLSPAAKAFRATYDRLLGEIGESPLSNAGARGEIAVHLASGDTKPYRVDILQAFRDPQKAVEMARGYHGAKPSPTAPGETGPTKTFHASNATITAPGAAQPEYKLTAHHATPHDVDRFSTDKIGTGEGAQAYGWGLYMAESESVSGVEGDYYKKFKAQHGKANAYTVELNADPEDMLDWDKPLSEQSEKVQQAVARVMQEEGLDAVPGTRTGADVYHLLQRYVPGGAEIASNRFEVKGIKGVRYLDQGSRNVPDTTVIERNIERTKTERDYWNQAGGHTAETRKAMLESYAKQISDLERELAEAKNAPPGTYNYVVFNADDIKITHANGQQIPVEHAMKQPQFSLDEEKQGGEGGGVPTRIYHGQKGDESPSGITFWSEDQSVAQSYANTGRSVGGSIGKGKPSVKSKDFTPRNPLDLSSITENTPWEEIRARLVDAGVKEDWLDDRFDSMAAESRPGAAGILDPMWAQDAEGLASELQRLGFDSVKVTEDHKPGWVTFEPSSEANRYSLADEYLPTAEEQAAARPPERDRPAAQIKSEMATAEEALREAVRLKVRPAATPAAKQAALDAMHLATATYRNLRDELLNSPEYIAKQIKRHHDAITEANEILKPTGQAVQADSFPNLNEMEDKLAPEQLERLSRLHAEIGSAQSEMGQMPGKLVTGIYAKMQREGVIPKAAPMAQGAGRTLDQMTERLRAAGQDSPNVPLSERLAIGRRVADAAEGTKDWLAKAQARTVASWKAGVDSIMHVPVDTEFMAQKRSKFQYDQQTSVEREAWAREFARKVPNPDRQKALALWLEASGDETLLQSQAKMAPKPYDRLFDLATKLTPGEKRIALDAKENWQLKLADAIKTGLVEKGRLDYIPQVWETPPKVETGDAPDPFGERKGGTAGNPYSKLDTRDPFFSFQRQTSTYFDGIMAGGKPRNLSLGYLVTHYDAAFHQALGSRLFVGGLQEACARDGAPVTKISGSATRKANGETGTATFVNAKSAGADSVTADGRPYRAYDHPSLKGWKFVTKDAQGNPTFVRGDMLIHPDHFAEVKNMLESPEWTRKGLGAAALRASSFLKSSKFIGPFHLVTEALHATFHGVNPSPWGLPEINLKDPRQARLAAHMTLGFGRQRELFEEGNGSHGGIWAKVPGLGEAVVRMNQFTFDEYIPRLKMKVGLAVLERNTARYAKELTPDQIAEVTGRQMDAAFGGQNFEMQGRSKSTLAVMRLALVAPDFLISRAKVIGQALKPYNQEQRVFLLAQAAGVYALCRVANSLFSDDHDPHFEPRNWDRVIIGKRGYAARFIVSDAANLARDLMGLGSFSQHGVPFVTGRLGVLPKMGMETLSGKDLFTGQNKDGLFDTDNPMLKAFSIVLKDVTEWSTPMALDSVMPGSTKKGQTPLGATGAALFGVSSRKESPATQVWNQARKFNLEGTDPKATAYQRMRDQETGTPSVYRGLNNLLDADDTDGAKEEIARLKAEGRTLAQIRQHYERHTYFTGSARRETAFFASLDAGAKDTYKAAKTEQAERAQKLAAALR